MARPVQPARVPDAGTSRSPGLEMALRSVLRRRKPSILDLGPMCGETVTYLASLGARVTVAEFEPPPAGRLSADRTVVLDYADHEFDLVLAWEQLDFTPPERLESLTVELHRVLAVGGWIHLLSLQRSEVVNDQRARYRVGTMECATREPLDEPRRPRWSHSSRNLQRSLAGFCIENVHLWQNQVREMVATSKGLELAVIARLPWNSKHPSRLEDELKRH
jgi:hypothetical protein